MVHPPMHANEVAVDLGVVRDLLVQQQPEWASLSLARVTTWGTDHVIFRLGDDLSVRLPKIDWAADQGDKEQRWLPLIAAAVGVNVPVPLFVGQPQGSFPYRWYVSPWLGGENPSPASDLTALAQDLATFIGQLHNIDTTDAPRPAPGERGGSLLLADAATRESAEQLRGQTDVDALLDAWQVGVTAAAWDRSPRWVHGDLMEGNLLVRHGRLVAVIDWGSCKAGDPAIDLIAGWTVFDEAGRDVLCERLGFVDDAMRLRARAWAVSAAVTALPYYRHTNPDIVARSWRTVDAVLTDLR